MRVISFPRSFIDNSVELEGTQQDYQDYETSHSHGPSIVIAEYTGQHTTAKLLKVANERVTFWITEEKK